MRRTLLYTALCMLPLSATAKDPAVQKELLLDTTQTVTGQPIAMPAQPRLQVTRLTIDPGAGLPVHKHPYPRYAYILKGEIEVTIEGRKPHLYHAGEFIPEVIDGWHFGTNHGQQPVELLVIDHTPQDVTSNIIVKDSR